MHFSEMKALPHFLAPILALASMGAALLAPAAEVRWSARNIPGGWEGQPAYVQTFTVTGNDGSLHRLAFNQFARQMRPLNDNDTLIEIVPGYYAIASPRLGADSTTVEILTRGSLRSICYAPDGVHGVDAAGNPFEVAFSRFDLLSDSLAAAAMPAAADIFARNEQLRPRGDETVQSFPTPSADRYAYRGMMIDIARNFQSAATLAKVLDLMALYDLNVLHFHFADDEAWRLEMPSLPELTAIGSRRGYTGNGRSDCLPQIFAGNGNPDAAGNTANGYISRQEFISLLQHADSLGIAVLPEIESPGHARAAIAAMRTRPGMRLDEEGDTSAYTSAQAFHDNVMNPALPGPYRFMAAVADDIADMYRTAGVALPAIHIGGDEVPRGAWNGSPAVARLCDSLGLADEQQVHAHFVRRIAEMLASKGIAVSGWQEIAVGHDSLYNAAVGPTAYSVNCWSTIGTKADVPLKAWEAGFPVVLSNVDHFYFDMCHSPHPYARGLSWGGYVDEFDVLHGYLSTVPGADRIRPFGVQGQIFAETLRSADDLFAMLLPKLPALAERAANPGATLSDREFNAFVCSQIPLWQQMGVTYHVRQPGALAHPDGTLEVNSSYPPAMHVIRYTLDGTDPDATSATCPPLAGPFAPGTRVKLRQWVGDCQSCVTVVDF